MSKECFTRYEVERQLWARWPRVLVVTEHSPQGTAQRRYVPESGEDIVRCRDCKYMHRVRNWLGMDVEECWLHADPESGALGKNRTEPDGFCSWGERRDGC